MDAGLTLTTNMALVFGLLAFTVLMLVLEWIRADLVALLVIVVIGLTRLLPVEQLFDGFAGNAVISLIAVMIMGAGLDRTGVLGKAASFILRLAGGVEARVSLLINAMAGVAVVGDPEPGAQRAVPAGGQPRQFAHRHAAQAPAAADGVHDPVRHQHDDDLELAADPAQRPDREREPQPAAGRADDRDRSRCSRSRRSAFRCCWPASRYFALFTRKLLPSDEETARRSRPGRTETYFAETYGIDGEVLELTVTADSPLVGMSVGEAEATARRAADPRAEDRQRGAPRAAGDQMIWVGSVLGVLGKRDAVNEFANTQLCQVQTRLRNFGDLFNPTRAGISEAVIPPNSRWIKQSIGDLRLRKTLRHLGARGQSRRPGVPRGRARGRAARRRHAGAARLLARPGADRRIPRLRGRHRLSRRRNSRPSKIWHAVDLLRARDGPRPVHRHPAVDRDAGRRGRHAADRRAQHGRGLRRDQLEDDLHPRLPDPARLGDGFDRRRRVDRAGSADAISARGRNGGCRRSSR